MKLFFILLLAILCTSAKRKNTESVLNNALKVRINGYVDPVNIRVGNVAEMWLDYLVANAHNGKEGLDILIPINHTNSNAECDLADNDTKAKVDRQSNLRTSISFHKRILHVLREENLSTMSKFDHKWIHQIKKFQRMVFPLNPVEHRGMRQNMMELHNNLMKTVEKTSPKPYICHVATMLERYVCTLLSPEIIVFLDQDLAETTATTQKHHYCNELFNKDNSQWKRSLSLIGCLEKWDQKLQMLLSKWLQVKFGIMKAFPTL